jgi:UDP-glucose 4-epimerase
LSRQHIDYIHVGSFKCAHVLALQQLLKNGDTRAVNLGMGHGASVRPVIYIARRNIGLEIRPRYVAVRQYWWPT